MEAIETITRGDLTASIYADTDAESPRTWDNLWTLHLQSSDSRCREVIEGHADKDDNERLSCDGLLIALHMFEDWQPVVRIDASETPESDGCYAFVSRARLLEEYGHKIVTKADKTHAVDVLKSELTALNQYFAGDVFGFVIEDEDGEHLDSCWSFYGLDYAKEEAQSALDYQAEQRATKDADAMLALDQFDAVAIA